ncbi:MAG: hypothetical protein NC336_04030 [Clostridium sp.]|nr:hypothetical protein [Clostridium sp.]
MNICLSLIISLIAYIGTLTQSVTEYFNAGNPIEFCDTKFYLAWSDHPRDIYYVQEYLPKGETLDHFNQMFTVNVVFWDRTPAEAVQKKIAELEERKKTDPVINYMSFNNEEETEYILDFVVSDTKGEEIHTVEFNVYHYKQMTIDGRKAMILEFYSARAYDDDITAFFQTLP